MQYPLIEGQVMAPLRLMHGSFNMIITLLFFIRSGSGPQPDAHANFETPCHFLLSKGPAGWDQFWLL